MKKLNLVLTVTFFAGISTAMASFADSFTPPVQITAWGMHDSGQVIYKYQVRNLGAKTINRFLIGHYPSVANGRAELSIAPIPEVGAPSFWLSAQIAERPNGWGARIVFPEESDTFSIEWIEGGYYKQLWPKAPGQINAPIASQTDNGIPANTTRDNFSVRVPSTDIAYVQGHATVAYASDLVNVAILKGDTVAPSINMVVKRLNQNEGDGTWAIFDVQARVQDNYDPSPALVFEPISSNQPLAVGDVVPSFGRNSWTIKLRNQSNRTYQMKYTATDASGNVSVKTFDYAANPK